MDEKRFLLTYHIPYNGLYFEWFETEDEMNIFIKEQEIEINWICDKLEILNVREID